MLLNTLLLFGVPHGWEWVLIAIVVILLFGGKKIPELIKGIGKGVKDFNDAKKGEGDSDTEK